MIAIVTIGMLGSIITLNGKDQTKKAYEIEIKPNSMLLQRN